MPKLEAHKWLRTAAKQFQKSNPDFLAKFEDWRLRMRRRITGRRLEQMTAGQFGVYLIDMQKRWSTLARLKGRLGTPSIWPRTHRALLVLCDGSLSLRERLDDLRPAEGTARVPHLSQAVITAILHIRDPQLHCVWNGTAKKGMESLGLWPAFPRGSSFADKYMLVNAIASRCVRETGIPMPLLDAMWWQASHTLESAPLHSAPDPGGLEGGAHEIQSRTKRDAAIIRRAKLLWSDGGRVSPECVVCGWSMEDVYGEHGFGFIEAHHDKPLGGTTGPRLTTIEELSPVCPNCHAILHRSGLTMDELQDVVETHGMSGT